MHNLFNKVKALGDKVPGRHLLDIFDHGAGEMVELKEEIDSHTLGSAPGDDGIVGEAVDVILCMVDLIQQHDSTITEEQIMTIVDKKLKKWDDKYLEPDD